MRSSIKLLPAFLFLLLMPTLVKAQEERNKMVMTINYGGKTITTELTSASFGLSRYDDYAAPAVIEDKKDDKVKTAAPRGNYYLSINIKKVDTELLKVFAKKETRFNGTITITDTYGKNPPREIKFTKASLDSYSDQYTAASYDDAYSYAAVVLGCNTLTINGVEME